jgi:hypothetical protein
VVEGIGAALPQAWDDSAIHPCRSVSIGVAAPNFSPILNSRDKFTSCTGGANGLFNNVHYLTQEKSCRIYGHMKTTIELPDAILERTKVAAAHRRTSMKNLVIQGLEMVLQNEVVPAQPVEALTRLRCFGQRGQALIIDMKRAAPAY